MTDFLRLGLRKLVSGKRKRLRLASGINLDLSYVTPQLIAMSFPASSIEALYRNEIKDVAKYLNERHGNGYMIYNLSERLYDYSLFEYRVVDTGWPDHMTAPLHVYIELCHAIDSWLASDKSRVAVVHCLAGKGRTGAACASYLVYSSISSSNSEDTMPIRERVFYAEKGAAAEAEAIAEAAGAEIITDVDVNDEEEGADEDEDDEEEDEYEDDETGGGESEESKPFFERDNINAKHEELASEYNVPSASEMAARAMNTFLEARGDGLGYAAQKRSVHYVARLIRSAILTAIAESKAASDSMSSSSVKPIADNVPTVDGLFRHWSQAEKAVHLLKAPAPINIQIHTIIFRAVPKMGRHGKLKPFLTLQPQPHQDLHDDSLFSSFNDEVREYHLLDGSCVFNLNECIVSGDVLLRCMNVKENGKVKECFRFSFNTTMLHDAENNGLGDMSMYHVIIERDMIDMNKRRRSMKRRIPLDFAVDLYYSLSDKKEEKIKDNQREILLDKDRIHPTVVCDERLYSAEHIVEQAVLSSQIRGNSLGYTV